MVPELRQRGPGERAPARRRRARDLSAPRLLVLSFAGLIAAGTAGFLLLPGLWIGPRAGFVDALFTATSAVCVTGLSVFDVSSRLTFLGQLWLLLLIQLGGLGILTLAALAASTLFGRRASLEVEEAVGVPAALLPAGDPRALVRSVVAVTFAVEALGAAALWLCWWGRLGPAEAVWPSVFHAISAFCNAGFSIFRGNLVGFAAHPPTLLVVSALIVLGGIGFLVIEELRGWLRQSRRRRLSVHTRLVLGTTALFVAAPAVLFWLYERGHALAALSPLQQAANALFLSITPRTAGFNTVDYDAISNPSLMLTLALMWVGGSPGSTAGGVKTTTAAILALVLIARLRGAPTVTFANRSIPEATVERAVGLAAGGTLLLFGFVFLLLGTVAPATAAGLDRGGLVRLVFEAQSALGTVGLSMNLTSELTPAGRLVIVAMMFLGRIGPLAAFAAMARRAQRRGKWRLGREDVLVG